MTIGKMRKKGGYSSSDNYGIKPTVKMCDRYYPKNFTEIGEFASGAFAYLVLDLILLMAVK